MKLSLKNWDKVCMYGEIGDGVREAYFYFLLPSSVLSFPHIEIREAFSSPPRSIITLIQ